MRAPFVAAYPTLLRSAVVAILVVWVLRDVALLVGYAVLLAYALLPVVRVIERLRGPRGSHVPRVVAAGGVMLLLVGGLAWLTALAVPRVVSEAAHFAANAPEILSRLAAEMHRYAAGHALGSWLEPTIARMRAQGPIDPERLAAALMTGVNGALGGVGNLLCLALLPLLAFYLLADAEAVSSSSLRFIPEASRAEIMKLGWAVDRALRSYVRGQAVVCLVTGLSVGIGLALLRHPAALLLGLLAGAAELIPFLGFLIAAGAIAFAGSGVSTLQAVLGVLLYVSLNWAIGTFVTPRLMGRYLKMHPFVVTVSVLAGAKLLGPAGALLALPGAAVLQAIIGELAPAAVEAERIRSANAVAAGAQADETARSVS